MDDVIRVKIDNGYAMKHRGPLPTEEVQEKVLSAAGCSAIWDDPQSGDRIFSVERMPENMLMFGIKWILV